MPIISITQQPATGALKAAYRPITLIVRASRTDGAAQPPVVYCDIYVDGVYYKSIQKTQYLSLGVNNSDWKFDIQDPGQEVLTKLLGPNGGNEVLLPFGIGRSFYCKFRSSGYDVNGFILAEGTPPVQGTGTIPPISGNGVLSNTFFVVNAVLQHMSNQDLAAHLNSFKTLDWEATSFPLSHRKPPYKICKSDSDFFPILSANSIAGCLMLLYKLKGQSEFQKLTWCPEPIPPPECIAASIPSPPVLDDATEGLPYNFSFVISGDAHFLLVNIVKPDWITIEIDDHTIEFSGTPPADSAGLYDITFDITNCASSVLSFEGSITIDPAADPGFELEVFLSRSGSVLNGFIEGGTPPYIYEFKCFASGSPCAMYTIANPTGSSSDGLPSSEYSVMSYQDAIYKFRIDVTDSLGATAVSNFVTQPMCLVPNTKITMHDNTEMLLSSLKAGDQLFGYNEVLSWTSLQVDKLYIINKNLLETSEGHLNIMHDRRLKMSIDLIVGDKLINRNGEAVEIFDIEVREGLFEVINISTKTKNYIANGLLTHNKLSC